MAQETAWCVDGFERVAAAVAEAGADYPAGLLLEIGGAGGCDWCNADLGAVVCDDCLGGVG